jgi:hypothetical protein
MARSGQGKGYSAWDPQENTGGIMTKSGKRLIEAAKEAVAIARGEKRPARLQVPPEIDVKAIRGKAHQ